MPSPFPGMDPYLEQLDLWPVAHLALLTRVHDYLNATLSSRYVARMDRHVWLVAPEPDGSVTRRPDVAVVHDGDSAGGVAVVPAIAAPRTTRVVRQRREGPRYVRIIDAGRRVVTAVELLSPANKRAGRDRDAYLAKRCDYLATGTNLVEIDLLRQFERMPFADPVETPYCVAVARHDRLADVGLWPVGLRDPLPTVPVPLADGDADVTLPLQSLFAAAYDAARLAFEIDYARSPQPPLPAADAAWAWDLLAARPAEGR